MTTSLFGGPTQGSQSRNLVEFKAGKMAIRENNWVHPDKRKGQVYIYQSEDEGLMHFCWKDRNTGVVEDDLTIFPDETKFKRVAQCKSGRVFLLSFKNAKKYFFWMQEPKEDRDEEFARKVNEYLNNPPSMSNRSRGAGPLGALGNNDVQELLGSLNMTQNELMTLLSMSVGNTGAGGRSGTDSETSTRVHSSAVEARSPAASSTGTTGTSAARPTSADTPLSSGANDNRSSDGGKIQLHDLHNILSNMSSPGGQSLSSPRIDLSELVNMETMKTLIENPEVQERLKPHLPSTGGGNDPPIAHNIETNIRSAQFRSAVKAFGAAIQTGEMAPVIAQFNLGRGVNEAVQNGDIVAFAKALEEANKKSEKTSEDTTEKMDEN